jgi:hypothetical protein
VLRFSTFVARLLTAALRSFTLPFNVSTELFSWLSAALKPVTSLILIGRVTVALGSTAFLTGSSWGTLPDRISGLGTPEGSPNISPAPLNTSGTVLKLLAVMVAKGTMTLNALPFSTVVEPLGNMADTEKLIGLAAAVPTDSFSSQAYAVPLTAVGRTCAAQQTVNARNNRILVFIVEYLPRESE